MLISNNIHQLSPNFKNFSFDRKTQQYNFEKKIAINEKVELLESLSTLTFVGALMTGVMDIDFSKKMSTKEKFSIFFLVATTLLLITKWIKQMQLSNEYDIEHKFQQKEVIA